MKIVLAGGSGFIGRSLTERLARDGHTITLLTRTPERIAAGPNVRAERWDAATVGPWGAVSIDISMTLNSLSRHPGRCWDSQCDPHGGSLLMVLLLIPRTT